MTPDLIAKLCALLDCEEDDLRFQLRAFMGLEDVEDEVPCDHDRLVIVHGQEHEYVCDNCGEPVDNPKPMSLVRGEGSREYTHVRRSHAPGFDVLTDPVPVR